LQANGVHRDLCIMGGEPLSPDNQFLTLMIVNEVKEKLPNTKIYIWSGYTLEELKRSSSASRIQQILSKCEQLVDGRFILAERDITLKMRGSKNQRIIDCKNINWNN
jgi:anaerobic ribonucleoside-triphosphate reductase activating protein